MFGFEYMQRKRIELLNTSILSPTSLYFRISFLILFCKIYPEKLLCIFMVSILSLMITIMYQLKSTVNYLSYRLMVLKVFKERKKLKYFLDGTNNDHIYVYNIPLPNKKIEYIHPYLQSGYIHAGILRSINSEIKCILTDNSSINKNLIFI